MKTVVFENKDEHIETRCKCFIDDPCWDVFENNCVILRDGVKFGGASKRLDKLGK